MTVFQFFYFHSFITLLFYSPPNCVFLLFGVTVWHWGCIKTIGWRGMCLFRLLSLCISCLLFTFTFLWLVRDRKASPFSHHTQLLSFKLWALYLKLTFRPLRLNFFMTRREKYNSSSNLWDIPSKFSQFPN